MRSLSFLKIPLFTSNEPLQLWLCQLPENIEEDDDAHIERVADDHISSTVIELVSSNLSNTFITCPAQINKTLGIKLPFIVLVVKNMHKYFSFEVEILDDSDEKRRIRASNYQISTRVKPYMVTMPMRLDPGWNQVIINLGDYNT
ncbi:hypothetical protein G6F56_012924 [Rhizopus delemar]|nr:hypothetical protein G6F56_012924 [Rhizopus delemar]